MGYMWAMICAVRSGLILPAYRIDRLYNICIYIVKPQWLEHLWDHGNSFETWLVRAAEG